ncbi:MAG: PQQ-binding-like beta-propeller repeat protein [Planctomycetaceae bacterium]|jgi:outer membrane protein assembly factor BamB|nr:PQQ-binding-like beta-propeller repeat protein [Planctomycetaceae bacterium]
MTSVLETSKVPGVKPLYYLSVFTAVFSGVFCVAFVAVLLCNYAGQTSAAGSSMANDAVSYRQPAADAFNLLPTDEPEIHRLKKELAKDKQNVELQEQIRQLDLALRLNFFQRRELAGTFAPLLLFAAVVFVISTRTVAVLKRKIPQPAGEAASVAKKSEAERLQLGTVLLTALSALFAGLALGLILLPDSSFETVLAQKLSAQNEPAAALPAEPEKPETQSPARNAPLDKEAFLTESAKNWVSFLSPFRERDSQNPALPVKWDAATGENLIWKAEIPLPGKSSPVIWGDKLFLTGATGEKRQVFCFSTTDGKLLWTADCPSTPESSTPFDANEDTGFAAPTAVVDGRRVYAMFANGDIASFDFNGKCVWNKSLGIPESSYGFSSSPALYFDKLIVQYDVGDGTTGKSKLYAFDTATGKTVWETPREIPNSWSSPMVHKIGEQWVIITCGDPFVITYDPETGKELWRVKCLNGDVGPSPAVFGNIIFVSNQSPKSTAIDTSLSPPDVVWQGSNALPDTPSPAVSAERLFTLDSSGYLTGYDPKNVKDKKASYWELEIGGGESAFYSSPFIAGSFLYAFSKDEENAKAFVVDLSKAKTDESGTLTDEAAEAMRIAANPMGEPCVSSPALVSGKLFIRGTKTVFCIGTK